MKKPIVIGCVIAVVIVAIIALACAGVTWWGGSQYMSNNTKVTKEIIGSEVPAGFLPLVAMDTSDSKEKSKVAVLVNSQKYMVMLVTGGPSKQTADQDKFIEEFKNVLKNQNSGANNADISPDGNIAIKGKSYPKYKLTMDTSSGPSTGMALFLNYPDKTLLFACFAQTNIYNPEVPKKFLEEIKLP